MAVAAARLIALIRRVSMAAAHLGGGLLTGFGVRWLSR
jgi:hypothetical protein